MEWHADYSVGNEQFDADHKIIFQLLNKFRATSQADIDDALVATVVDELIEYTKRHFEKEEDFMKDLRYPGLVDHVAGHDEMINTLNSLKSHKSTDHIEFSNEVADFVDSWWVQHILEHDMAYKQYVLDGTAD